MAGRFAYFLIAGGAIVGGMALQGDLNIGDDRTEHRAALETDPAMKRALAAAVSELVRAEGGLIAARMDEATPAAVVKQAEQRRNAARQAVERLSVRAKAQAHSDRNAVRQRVREEVRESVRDAVRS